MVVAYHALESFAIWPLLIAGLVCLLSGLVLSQIGVPRPPQVRVTEQTDRRCKRE